jgi:hypothetical protein
MTQDEIIGEAPIKGEGTAIRYNDGMKPSEPLVETEWIEFSLPSHLEDECREMIKQWLEAKGVRYD